MTFLFAFLSGTWLAARLMLVVLIELLTGVLAVVRVLL